MPTLKQKLHSTADRLTLHVCTIPSATVPQAMAAAGADAVIIDLEHGAVDYGTAHAMIAACAGTSGDVNYVLFYSVHPPEKGDQNRVQDWGLKGIMKTADCLDPRRRGEERRWELCVV